MAHNAMALNDIHCCSTNWTTLVQVIEAAHVLRTGRFSTGRRYRCFILANSQGIQVKAIAVDNAIPLVDGLLLPFKKYFVSNASVHLSTQTSSTTDYPYYWTITAGTTIEEVNERGDETIPPYLPLHHFSNIQTYADSNKYMNIFGIVVFARPMREIRIQEQRIPVRDYVIINEEKKPVILTLYNDFQTNEGIQIAAQEEPSVILAMRLRATTTNYLSLATQVSSVIMVQPALRETMELNHWFHNNISLITQMIQNEAYADPRVLLPPVSTNEIIPINRALQTTRFKRTAWIEGRAEINYQKAPFWYFTCPNCHEPTDFITTLDINCQYCTMKINPTPKACIALAIVDATGQMDTIVLGDEAEKLMCIQAAELTEINNQNMILLHHITRAIQGKRLMCFVKKATPKEKAIRGTAFTIVTSYEVQQLAADQQTSMNLHNDQA